MSTAHITHHHAGPGATRLPGRRRSAQAASESGHAAAHPSHLRSALRKAGILVGTVARVTILGRDGVDM